jgi:amino acid adenylation domain-containing protein
MPDVEAIYELSPLQSGMLFHSIYAPDSAVYFEQTCAPLRGPIDVARFETAWQRLTDRHGVLRTSFHWEEAHKPLQVVHRQVRAAFTFLDWTEVPAAEQPGRLAALLDDDRRRGFGLTSAPLLRTTLVRHRHDDHALILSFHHLLLDGWSVQVLRRELALLYERPDDELDAVRPFAAYIGWLQERDPAVAEAFWRRELAGIDAPTPLPLARRAPVGPMGDPSIDDLVLPQRTTDALQAVARDHRLTLNTIVHGAWALLLARYTGEDDVVFGSVVAGRPHDLSGVESMVGLFINTVPVRATIDDRPLVAWLRDLQDAQAARMPHEWAPLVQVHGWSGFAPGLPLFRSLIAFENYPVPSGDGDPAGGDAPSNGAGTRSFTRTDYPLSALFTVEPALHVRILSDPEVYEPSVIQRLAEGLRLILEGIAADPTAPIATVAAMPEAERDLVLRRWGTAPTPPLSDRTLTQRIEDQVDLDPDAPAVSFDQHPLTYRELDQQANRLARHLIELGVGPGSLVGILLDRSAELVVAVLATLKARAAFVPLDPAYPADRLTFMVDDAGLTAVVSDSVLAERAPLGDLAVVRLDVEFSAIADHDAGRLEPGSSSDLCYVIYTSGSTGRPKGVLVEHRGVGNVADGQHVAVATRAGDRVLQLSSLSFDGFVFELVLALTSGATLVLGRREELVPGPALADFIEGQGITTVLIPPSALQVVPADRCASLRTINVAGEACTTEIVDRWAPGRRFLNLYGPSEASIWCAWSECVPGMKPVPIGRPIPRTTAYVLDARLQPAPVGVPGELHIGGVAVSRGYLNRPDLTEARFIDDPFDPAPGARLYRTGDLVRWSADGELEFLGRLDEQLKLRGFRVEPGEVEAALRAHPDVRDAVVVARSDQGDPRLVGYVVTDPDSAPNHAELRAHLLERLPDFMVPAAFVTLDALARTPSGKVDRRALPAPAGSRPALSDRYVAPRTDVEAELAAIWGTVLRVDDVGAFDNFFDLGGHSLLATQLVSRVRETLAVDLPLAALFEHPTVAGLGEVVDALVGAPVLVDELVAGADLAAGRAGDTEEGRL